MKRLSVTLLAVLMVAANMVFATQPTAQPQILNAEQVAKLDLNGKWSGKRNQYSADKKSFIESFQYEFEIVQKGDLITGTSSIITANGEYADMELEGVIVGNKLHFAEKNIKSAVRPDGKVWCFKSGELFIVKDGDNLKLVGSTPSYMEVYNFPCSGGETDLVKVDNSNNLAVLQNAGTVSAGVEDKMAINVFPNPFIDNATVYYNLTEDAKVKADVYDISGKLVNNLYEGNQKAGSYNLGFNAKNTGSLTGIFIVKLVVNGEVYSRQLVQMR